MFSAGKKGLSPLTKCTAAVRMLAYGIAADCVDEYLKIGESTALECMKNFCAGVVQTFGEEYLRKPTQADVDRLLAVAEARDFPGMLGRIHCMHWEWKNCPTGWKGEFAKGNYKVPTLILEAVASYDLWIWHAFFGCPGTINDLQVLDRSPVFQSYMKANLQNVNMSSTVASTTPATTFLMVSIQNGRHSSKQFVFLKGQRQNYSLNVKKQFEKTSRERLGCYKLDLLSFVAPLDSWRRESWV